MDGVSRESLIKANDEAIYQLYLCLANKTAPTNGATLYEIAEGLQAAWQSGGEYDRYGNLERWKTRDVRRLRLLRAAIHKHPSIADARIGDQVNSKEGLGVCSFTKRNGDISIVFRGTGSGEWIDNGEGLSGKAQENTYVIYGKRGQLLSQTTITNDHATDQQAEALNVFRRIVSENGWDTAAVTVSGYSKGGNKAQFIAMHTAALRACYSFCGQGFSPEAIAAFRAQGETRFEERRRRIVSLAADNDYVSALGDSIVLPQHNLFFSARLWEELLVGYHFMEAILQDDGRFRPLRERGALGRYVQAVWQEIVSLDPAERQAAVLGLMNVIQQYKGVAVNGDEVSLFQTIRGIAASIDPLVGTMAGNLGEILTELVRDVLWQ